MEGLDTSVNAMDPLNGLNEDEEIRFMRWLNIDERKMLNNAYKFFEHIKNPALDLRGGLLYYCQKTHNLTL